MKTVYTCILGVWDDLKEPTVITPGWKYICFTDQPFASRVWEIKHIDAGSDPQRKAREIKIMFHKYIGAVESLWLDGSFHIQCDLNKFWSYFKSPFTAPRHPLRHCWEAEGRSCIANGRGNIQQVAAQMAAYKEQQVPMFQDNIISSGLLMRDKDSIPLCEAWFAELSKWSTRDQLAFARVCGLFEWWMFSWDYSQSRDLLYKKHLHLRQ